MCSGETIDYDLIISKLQEIKEKFKVQGIGYDNWNFKFIKMKVLRMGFTIQEVSQLAKGQSEPLKLVEKLLIDGDLSISDNPAALWNWRNVRVQVVDTKNNIHINKNESEDSVDGAVALNNAMSLYFSQVLEPMAPAK
jgi:phage terminase large subunit-like protein